MSMPSMKEWIESLPDDLLDILAEEDGDTITMLQGLNANQLRAVTTLKGPIQINAVAGSGKTAVLTKRIAYMRIKGIKANQILCTTFTKKATEEMITRLGKLVPQSYINMMDIGTTHSIGYRILKREFESLNHHMAAAFKKDILMNTQKRFMEDLKKDIMKDMTVPYEVKQELNEIAIPQFMKAFGLAKNENIGPLEYEMMHSDSTNRMQAYVLFYKRYEMKKWDEQLIDGDDLLFLLVRLFQEQPEILDKYKNKYKYLLVDEAQDNNGLQYTLIKMLAEPENNVFLVGDDDQSMYSFRGAKPEEFIQFRTNFKNATMIPLEYNYRSKPGILTAANKLIANNRDRISKQLRTHKTDEDQVVTYSSYKSENDEAKAVVEEIKNLVDEQGKFTHKQVAILYRTNAQSRAFEDQLIMSGMPYVIHGGISFYERAEVKDIVAYLKLVEDPNDNEAFERIYNKPKRYLGKAFLTKAKNFSESYWSSINTPSFLSKLTYEKRGVADLRDLLDALMQHKESGGTVEELIDIILENGGYKQFLLEEGDEEEEGNSRLENIETLKYVVAKFKDVTELLDYVYKMTTTAKHDINGVQLMTIHKSKGLEFKAAFVVGMSEGILPHFKSIEAADETGSQKTIEEERRLGYVAVTRAEELCRMSSPGSFNGRPAPRSRFIKEMYGTLVVVNEEVKDADESSIPGLIDPNLQGTEQGRLWRNSEGLEAERRAIGRKFNEMMAKEIRETKKLIRECTED
ncbi:ATP-dependent DNA helicase PcrA [compost metagenome]